MFRPSPVDAPKKDDEIALAHTWQSFRIRCLELAISSGAKFDSVIEVADRLGKYILTRSEVEIGASKPKDD